MADLTYVEKLQLEKLLGMGSGWVLNFSDRTFQEFVFDSIGIDLYGPGMDAGGTSKAKRLRHFMKTQPTKTVGRLLSTLFDYYEVTESSPDTKLLSGCRRIAERLVSGQIGTPPPPATARTSGPVVPSSPSSGATRPSVAFVSQSEVLLKQFEEMVLSADPHRRGYLLEALLVRTFQLHSIEVVRSFRRNAGSEQIDAAFKLEGWHYLVECRWRDKLADTRQVDGLGGQVRRSGKQTMGLFCSINGWSQSVPANLKQNPDKSVLLMDGYDLRVVLEGRIGLREMLLAKLAHFNIEGEPFVSVSQILSSQSG